MPLQPWSAAARSLRRPFLSAPQVYLGRERAARFRGPLPFATSLQERFFSLVYSFFLLWRVLCFAKAVFFPLPTSLNLLPVVVSLCFTYDIFFLAQFEDHSPFPWPYFLLPGTPLLVDRFLPRIRHVFIGIYHSGDFR